MDFKRTQICSSDQLDLTDYAPNGDAAAYFDNDSDLVMTKNGASLIPKKPITNYEWVEFTIDAINGGLTLFAYTNSQGGVQGHKVTISESPFPPARMYFRIPNIGDIERFDISTDSQLLNPGDICVIKKIEVVTKTLQYQKAANQPTGHDLADGVNGWTYNPTDDTWEVDLSDQLTHVINFTDPSVLAAPGDAISVKVQPIGDIETQVLYFYNEDIYDHAVNYLGRDIELQFPYGTTFPRIVNILGFAAAKVTIRKCSFPAQVSVFGGGTQVLPGQLVQAPISPLLGSNNIWDGSQTFNSSVTINGSLALGALNGFLKAVAGVVGVGLITSADIAGAGDIITHNVNEFAQVANNLGDLASIPGARVNLGLGTAALQSSAFFLQAGNNLGDLSNVATARANLGLGSAALQPVATFLQAANNLSDLTNAGLARTNLGLGSSSTLADTTWFKVANNLSEGTSATMRANLGLGTAAVQNVEFFFQLANNLSDGVPATMRNNLGLGTMATQNANAVNITGGTIAGVALSIASLPGPTVIDNSTIGLTTPAAGRFTNVRVNTAAFAGAEVLSVTGLTYFNGGVGIGNPSPVTAGGMVVVGGTHQGVNPTGYEFLANGVAPSTMTTRFSGFYSSLTTTAAAYTITVVDHFAAATTSLGAGSAITSVYGFRASNQIAVGSNNYGFFSDIASASSTYQAYLQGTAESYFGGPVGILQPVGASSMILRVQGTHPNASATANGIYADVTLPATITSDYRNYGSIVRTAATAFNINFLNHFAASQVIQGAGSSISNVRGFFASNSIAGFATSTTIGFASDINYSVNLNYSFYGSGTAQARFNGPVGIGGGGTANTMANINLGALFPITGGSTPIGLYISGTLQSGVTAGAYGIYTDLSTTNAVYTLSSLIHYAAFATTKGASNTLTSVYGFHASNAIAAGSNNYGFFSNINTATNTWQLYMSGTADSYFGAPIGIGTNAPTASGAGLYMSFTHPATTTTVHSFRTNVTAPSTATSGITNFTSALGTVAAAFTCGNVFHFDALSTSLGAGSTITSVRGFSARNAIAVATANNYGFYSDIDDSGGGAANWQFMAAGSAASRFAGPVSFGTSITGTSAQIRISGSPNTTAATISGILFAVSLPATATTAYNCVNTGATSNASAYTIATIAHFNAGSTTQGAGSTITNVYGFRANNAIVAGTNNYGFWSDMAAAANTFQLSLQGTAASRFGGPVYHAQDNSTVQAVSALFQGTGVPNNANGNNGDFYLRGDTPGTALQRLYVKSAGAWVGIL